jgi:hypothetical protein
MATAYKIEQFAVTQSNTSQEAFVASASNTVVSSVICNDATGATITLSVRKGTTTMQIVNQTLASNASTDLLVSPIALEATDKLIVTSTRASGSNFVISYVEDTNIVSGQSIGVLADVPTSLGTNGQVLAVNSGGTSLVYVDAGGSTATLDDIGNVNTNSKVTGDVIKWSGSSWVKDSRVELLYNQFRSGTSATSLFADGSTATDGRLELDTSTAKLKTGVSGIDVTESSPGELDFIVAAGSAGSETAFTAVELNGLTASNTATFTINNGTNFHLTGASGYARLSHTGGNAAFTLPSSTGTLAKTTDIALDSAVTANTAKTGITSGQASAITANTAKISYTDASAVAANTAKTGITAQQASDITANNAKVSYTDASAVTANTAKVGITTQQASDITANNAKVSYTDASAVTANTAKIATVLDDTSPQLGGNLDVQAREINTSTANGNIITAPKGTGVLEVKGDTNDGAIQLNCNQNLHGVKIQSPPHSASASYTLVLPNDTGTNGQVMTTDGSGNLSFTTVSSGGTNTNLANTNLTADNNRTYDLDSNTLTFDIKEGEFLVDDSSDASYPVNIMCNSGAVSILGLAYPATDGTNGQVLTTNGAGTLGFTTVTASGTDTNVANTNLTLNADRTLDTDGNTLTFDPNGGTVRFLESGASTSYINCEQGNLQLNGLSFPNSDGTSGQVLQTNGSGTLSFTTVSGGGGGSGGIGTADQTLDADRTIDTNGHNLDIELDSSGTADTFTIHDGTHDLFQVDTNTSGTLFGVNDVSGLPMFQSNSNGTMALPQILTSAPTATAPEGTMQLGIVSSTCYLYVYINGGWKSTTLT